jgi:hypothetical protein
MAPGRTGGMGTHAVRVLPARYSRPKSSWRSEIVLPTPRAKVLKVWLGRRTLRVESGAGAGS